MNKQEIFDTVVAHLRKQGKKAMRYPGGEESAGNSCAYRSADGLSCAFGCLITDEEYKPSFEGMSVMGVLQKPTCPQSLKDRLGITREEIVNPHGVVGLLQNLQSVHDLDDVQSWEKRLEFVAESYDLIYTPLEVKP